jgi:hypothetical protein
MAVCATYFLSLACIGATLGLLFGLAALNQNKEAPKAGATLPGSQAIFETSLQSRITSSDTKA